MEKLKTRNEYVGCNRKCRFYVDEIRATSYDWWTFVTVINGRVVFNDYSYSHTTSGHQWEVKYLMKNLGIKIDAYVYMESTLNESSFKQDALHHFYDLAIKHIVTNQTKRVRKKTIKENKETIIKLKETIKELKEIGAEFSFNRMLRIYRSYKNQRNDKEIFLKESKKAMNKVYRDNNNVRWIVVEKDLKNERLTLHKLGTKGSYGDRTTEYLPWFIKNYKYCNLSNALSI